MSNGSGINEFYCNVKYRKLRILPFRFEKRDFPKRHRRKKQILYYKRTDPVITVGRESNLQWSNLFGGTVSLCFTDGPVTDSVVWNEIDKRTFRSDRLFKDWTNITHTKWCIITFERYLSLELRTNEDTRVVDLVTDRVPSWILYKQLTLYYRQPSRSTRVVHRVWYGIVCTSYLLTLTYLFIYLFTGLHYRKSY